ncbi:MAG: hypothetical protein H6518_04475 [Microthrixaceae bacterium]|nr:hypothetical protein [Microthrixaceae bacterium]
MATLKGELVELDTAVLAAEAQLSAAGGDDLGDALARFESLRERRRGLAAVLAERRRASSATAARSWTRRSSSASRPTPPACATKLGRGRGRGGRPGARLG